MSSRSSRRPVWGPWLPGLCPSTHDISSALRVCRSSDASAEYPWSRHASSDSERTEQQGMHTGQHTFSMYWWFGMNHRTTAAQHSHLMNDIIVVCHRIARSGGCTYLLTAAGAAETLRQHCCSSGLPAKSSLHSVQGLCPILSCCDSHHGHKQPCMALHQRFFDTRAVPDTTAATTGVGPSLGPLLCNSRIDVI